MSYPSPLGHLLRSLHLTVACGSVRYGPYGVTREENAVDREGYGRE